MALVCWRADSPQSSLAPGIGIDVSRSRNQSLSRVEGRQLGDGMGEGSYSQAFSHEFLKS